MTTIGSAAFSNCTALWSINLEYVNKIGIAAFENTALLQANLRNITSIGHSAFTNCQQLNSLILGSELNFLDGAAFSGCTSLTSVTLPSPLKEIKRRTFKGCTALTQVRILGAASIEDTDYYLSDGAFAGCTALRSVVLPNTLTTIGDAAFYNCNLQTVDIPNSVTTIGGYAFSNNSSLSKAYIPASVTRMGSKVFDACAAGFTIYGYTGSRAHTYATENGHRFQSLTYQAPNAVTNFRAQVVRSGVVRLSWDPSTAVDGYIIYRKVGSEFKYLYVTPNTVFLDLNAKNHEWNFYWVFPYRYLPNGQMNAALALCTGMRCRNCPWLYVKASRTSSHPSSVLVQWGRSTRQLRHLSKGRQYL